MVSRLARMATTCRLRPGQGAAVLVAPKVGPISVTCAPGLLPRQTFAQLACLASRAPGGACVVTEAASLSYVARLRGQGLPIHWPASRLRLGEHRGPILLPWDEKGLEFSRSQHQRIWRYRFDFRPGMTLPPRECVVPYTMNPTILARRLDSRTALDHQATRPIRVMFAGGWRPAVYAERRHVTDLFGKLPRVTIVSSLFDIHDAAFPEGESWQHRLPGRTSMVVADSAVARVREGDWLSLLAMADFLICPPGAIMPLCYNIVEAMACGTVPITSYPEWLTPPLTPGVDCLAFSSLEDLHEQIDRARRMPDEDVAAMRHNVRRYYDTYLDQRTVFKRLMDLGPGELVLHAINESMDSLLSMVPEHNRAYKLGAD